MGGWCASLVTVNQRLNRQAILDASLVLADQEGLSAVTMRAVAERVGVTPMALYRHIGDKQGLLDGLVERLIDELPNPEPALSWPDQLAALSDAIRTTARRHPAVFPLLLQRPVMTAAATARREVLYAGLRDAGVIPELVPRVERLLSTFLLGFAASEASGRFRERTTAELDADLAWLQELVRRLLTVTTTAD